MGSCIQKPPSLDVEVHNRSRCPSVCCDSDACSFYCCVIIRNNKTGTSPVIPPTQLPLSTLPKVPGMSPSITLTSMYAGSNLSNKLSQKAIGTGSVGPIDDNKNSPEKSSYTSNSNIVPLFHTAKSEH